MKMRLNLVIIIAVLLLAVSTFATLRRTFIGGGADNFWTNPDNWDPPGVPAITETVVVSEGQVVDVFFESTIMVGVLINQGVIDNVQNICVGNALYNQATGVIRTDWATDIGILRPFGGLIFNAGLIETADAVLYITRSDVSFYGYEPTDEVENRGIIRGGVGVDIEGRLLNNRGRLETDGVIRLDMSETLDNEGEIVTTLAVGDVLQRRALIAAMNELGTGIFSNSGSIIAEGTTGETAPSLTSIKADNFYHTGSITTGDGCPVWIYARNFYLQSLIRAGHDYRSRPRTFAIADANFYADSIVISPGDSSIVASNIKVTARKIVVDGLPSASTLSADMELKFVNTNQIGSSADFSGTHTTASIASSGTITIKSNNIIPPTEGLNEICDPDPIIIAGGEDVNLASIHGDCVSDTFGATGSIRVVVLNRSSASKVMEYHVVSALGWAVTVSDSTDTLEPLGYQEFFVSYSIPPGLTSLEIDTLYLTLYMDGFYGFPINSSKAYIAAYPPEVALRIGEKQPPTPDMMHISAHPNPFNSAVRISVEQTFLSVQNGQTGMSYLPVTVEIFDLSGRSVVELPEDGTVGDAYMRPAKTGGMYAAPTTLEFTWTPDKSLPSGVYLVRARIEGRGDLAPTGQAAAVKRVVYLK